MKAGLGLAFCAGLFWGCASTRMPSPAPEPMGWIDSIPGKWRDEPVVVLAESLSLQFKPASGSEPGNGLRSTQVIWYAVQHGVPAELATLMVQDMESLESIPTVGATVWRRGNKGWESQGISSRFRRIPLNVANEYASYRFQQIANVPGYEDGLVVRLEINRSYLRPEFYGTDVLRGSFPILRKYMTFNAPNGYLLKPTLLNSEGVAARDSMWEDATGMHFAVTARRLPKISQLQPIPYPETWFAAVHYSLPAQGKASPTWVELGDHYLKLAEPFLRPDTALTRIAKSLAPEGTAPAEIVNKAFAYLQANFRYLADEQELHAFVPRSVSYVLRQGWGDCKELSSLLVALLRERGITSRLALVSTVGFFQNLPEHPSLGGFNHMICAWKNGSDWSFVDATANYGDANASTDPILGQRALLLEPGHSHFVEIRPPPSWKNAIRTESRIDKNGGGWTLHSKIVLEGESAYELYPYLRDAKGEEREPWMRGWVLENLGLEASHADVPRFDPNRAEIEVQAPFDRGFLPVDKGGLALEVPTIMGGVPRYTALKIEGPRVLRSYTQKDSWEVPPEFTDLDGGKFNHPYGQGEWRRIGNRIERTYRQERRVLTVTDSADLSAFYSQRVRFMRKTVWRR